MIKRDIIKAYALKNALEHDSKAIIGAVINSLFKKGLKRNKVKEIIPRVQDVINEINSWDLDRQKQEFEKLKNHIEHRKVREGLSELPKTKKGVIMRIAPSASGPLHIGHALTASISFIYTQKYNGKFYVRIEDTNPENVYKPAYKMLEKESKWLFNNKAKILIQSNRMNIYYKCLEKLLKSGKAYVCNCRQEEFKEHISNKKNCPCRNLSVKENLERWRKMLNKNNKTNYKPGKAVVRFKSNMQDKNPAIRDFPLARINTAPHPLQKNKYRVWPLMNLSVTTDDIDMKMTHIIRGKDHRDNAERQKMLYKALGKAKQYPWTSFLGRIHFKDMELSTRKIREAIAKGKYKAWDDKRLPTIASLKKQGYKPEAFWRFAEQIGLNEVDKNIDKKEFFLLLDNFNKNNFNKKN